MAQIDASIYQNVGRPAVQLADPMELQGKAMQLKSLVGQQQLQQLQIQQATEEAQNQRTLGDLYKTAVKPDGSVDRQALTNQAAQRGLGAKIPGLQKSWAEADKATADVGHVQAQTEASKFKVLKDKLDTASGAINSLLVNPNVNNEMVINTLTNLVQQGIMPPEQGAQIARSLPPNPAMLRQFLIQHGLQAMEASKRMEAMIPKMEKVDNGSSVSFVDTNPLTNPQGPAPVTKVATPDARLNAQTQMRGQNMLDARSRETLGASMTKPFEVTGPDGTPMLVQQDKQGNITPVAGFGPKSGASKPLNDTQAKALLFGTRMNEADKILGELAQSGTTTSIPGTNTGYGVGTVVSALAGDKQQQLNQAKRDFLNAVLRRESGAAIGSSEFDSGDKQYFPQPGDGPGVIAQKAKNRQLAIQGILAEVPEGQRNKLNATTGAAQPPAVGGISVDAIAAELARRGQK